MDHDHSIPGLTTIVDIYDQNQLFERLDNQRVLQLSRLNEQPGFSSLDAVRKSTGISLRRILAEGLFEADLAVALAERLQEVSQSSLSDFDAVFLCHSHTQDDACQQLARQLEDRLHLSRGFVRPLNYGCCGFLKMLHDAVDMLDVSDSSDARVALLSVETPETWHDASDRLFCGLVSAGATAAIVEKRGGLPLGFVRADDFSVPPERRPNPHPLFRRELADGFTFRGDPCQKLVMRMNAEPVFLNGIELMLHNLRSASMTIDRKPGQRVIVVPHQPSGKLLRALVAAASSEFPDFEFLNNLDQYGNTISSSVPTVLSRLPQVLAANDLPPIQQDDHLILLAAGICMTEIDNHMSAGYACLQWKTGVVNQPQSALAESLLSGL